jgi:hypothetical protein
MSLLDVGRMPKLNMRIPNKMCAYAQINGAASDTEVNNVEINADIKQKIESRKRTLDDISNQYRYWCFGLNFWEFARFTAVVHFAACCVSIYYTYKFSGNDRKLSFRTSNQIPMWVPSSIPSINDANDFGIDPNTHEHIQLDTCHLSKDEVSMNPQYKIRLVTVDTDYSLPIDYMVCIFFFLSFFFQFLHTLSFQNYEETLQSGKTIKGHYIEYSLSATILFV